MTSTTKRVADQLAIALSEGMKAKPYVNEENPLGNHTVEQLARGAGILKVADLLPQQSKAPTTRGEWLGGDAINMAVREGLDERQEDRSAKRMATARARAQRKRQFDDIGAQVVVIDDLRMTQAWMVVFPLVPIITRIANSKRQWAGRFLGSTVDDIPSMALEKCALVLAKSDCNLTLLRVAADELAVVTQDTGRVPGHQDISDEERTERKEIKRARKWLMGLVNNRVMGALVDAYTEVNNLRWENIDVTTTVMASIAGVGEDPLYATSKADRSPALLGTHYQRPGGIDPNVLSQAICAGITAKGLDPMVELLLDIERVRADGAFMWTDNARDVFMATPGEGAWMWATVVRATNGHANQRRSLGDAARVHVRNQFEWLPHFIVSVIEAMDIEAVQYHQGFAIMESALDGYLHRRLDIERDAVERATRLRPMLTYATTEEAARALIENLSILSTGEDLISSIVHA